MEAILENPKYLIAGALIVVALIVLVVFLINSRKKYDIDGKYFLHPMKFINCKIKSTSKKDEFNVEFDTNRDLVPIDQLLTIEEQNAGLNQKKGKIKMTGKKNSLGNELFYFENEIKYNGVHLDVDYNLYAKKNDILVVINEETRESFVFKKLEF